MGDRKNALLRHPIRSEIAILLGQHIASKTGLQIDDQPHILRGRFFGEIEVVKALLVLRIRLDAAVRHDTENDESCERNSGGEQELATDRKVIEDARDMLSHGVAP